MMYRAILGTLVLGMALLILTSSSAWAYQYPDSAKRATEEYLTVRRQLDAQADPALEDLKLRPGVFAGRALDLRGDLCGCTMVNSEGKTTYTYLLKVSDELTVPVQFAEELRGIRVGERVRALVQMPRAGSVLSGGELKGIVREDDLPVDLRPKPAGDAQPPAPAAPAADLPPAQVIGSTDLANAKGPYFSPEPAPPVAPPVDESGQVATPTAGGTDLPAYWMEQKDIEVWKAWVADHNSKLTDQQCELIVRWIIHYAQSCGLDHRLCFAVAEAESDFHPDCVSSAGATGVMQLMPSTAEAVGVRDRWNVHENVRGGIRYLADQVRSFEGRNNYDQTALGLAAYNAGPGAVKRYGGIPPYRETTNYVKRITARFYQLWKDGYP